MILETVENNDYMGKLTVLYVEDEETTLETLTTILESKVAKVYTARDGIQGLEVFKNHKNSINVVVTDIRMPNMNGITMVKNIKDINPNVKIIYLSAHNEGEILTQAINGGADGFILKPIGIKSKLISMLFKFSKDIYKDKIIQDFYNTIKLLLNTITNIVVVTDGKKVIRVNQAFLDFFYLENLDTFRLKYKCICDLFIKKEGYLKPIVDDGRTWIEYAFDMLGSKVLIEDRFGNDREFVVKVNVLSLDDTNPIYVAEFIDTNAVCKV
jgi:two-component system cell cycle response regulator